MKSLENELIEFTCFVELVTSNYVLVNAELPHYEGLCNGQYHTPSNARIFEKYYEYPSKFSPRRKKIGSTIADAIMA